MDDPMIYVKVTPNRPDALGVYGIARDLAAKGLGRLKTLDVKPLKGAYKSPVDVVLTFDDPDNKPCPLFIGRHFRGIKNGPSPDWMQRRLQAIGLRPISALVDITNYITYGYGRPLHVFDAAKVKGAIRPRLARAGETLEALDGKTYALDDTMTVIADDNGPEGLGGVMGGEASGCTPADHRLLPRSRPVRSAAHRRDGAENSRSSPMPATVSSAASIRASLQTGAEIATRLILDICGGEASDLVIAGKAPDVSRSYLLRKTRVRDLGGIDVPLPEQKRILESLGFVVTETSDGLDCAVPSWRLDVGGEPDLVEEVCRIVGLDTIEPAAMPRLNAVARPVLNTQQRRMVAARRRLAERGLNEAVTWSFLTSAAAELFGGGHPSVKLANPISSELSDMRPSLLPNLISAAGRNMARGFADLGLFEVGQCYHGDAPEDETLRATGIRRGAVHARHWSGEARAVDLFDAKADAMAVLAAAGAPVQSLQVVQGGPDWFHPGRSGTIQLGPKNQLGWFGEIHPGVLDKMDVKGPVVAFEIVLDNIPEPKSKSATRPPLDAAQLLPVRRDFAFVVADDVAADKLVRAARAPTRR